MLLMHRAPHAQAPAAWRSLVMPYHGESCRRQAGPAHDTTVCVVRALVALGRHAELPEAEIRARVLRDLQVGLGAERLDRADLETLSVEWERALDQVIGRAGTALDGVSPVGVRE